LGEALSAKQQDQQAHERGLCHRAASEWQPLLYWDLRNRYRNQQRDWERLAALDGARITRPACFIAGRRDGVLKFIPNFDLVENMKRWVDDLRVCEIIDGAGHWIQQERPDEVTKLLLGFLATLR